ncbi:hypothetical protein LXL04_008902 [Taraxacum kok-saghyz]
MTDDGGWTKVWRRKQTRVFIGDEITTFFVAGFPGGTTKEALKIPFEKFGQVVDVYLGRRKDFHRKNFAFVRFKGVMDEKDMEETLQGIKFKEVTLDVNIARHQRKVTSGEKTQSRPSESRILVPPRQTHQQTNKGRDFRSFAQVAVCSKAGHTNNTSAPIRLNTDTAMNKWVSDNVIIGEVLSMEHIKRLPESIKQSEGIKYLGGLQLAIRFELAEEASSFLANPSWWKDWFNWIKRGDDQNIRFERIAWIRIIGLPLFLWDTENFSSIASRREAGSVDCCWGALISQKELEKEKAKSPDFYLLSSMEYCLLQKMNFSKNFVTQTPF